MAEAASHWEGRRQTGLGNPNKFSVHTCGEGLFETIREGGPRNFGNLKGLLDYATPEGAEANLKLLAGVGVRSISGLDSVTNNEMVLAGLTPAFVRRIKAARLLQDTQTLKKKASPKKTYSKLAVSPIELTRPVHGRKQHLSPTYYGSYDHINQTDESTRQDYWTMGRADRKSMRDHTFGHARPIHNGTIQMNTTTKGELVASPRPAVKATQPVWQHMRTRHLPEAPSSK